MDISLYFLLAVVLIATLVRSTFGFGEALIAVPLLSLLMPVQVAAPLAAALSVTVAAAVVIQDWRHIHLSSVFWLLLPSLLGIPIGVWMLRQTNPLIAKAALGVFIVGFSGYVLAAKKPLQVKQDNRPLLLGSGFLAGIFGGAFGMNGPPLVVYGTLRGWSPAQTRATLQGYFLPASSLGVIGYYVSGLWTTRVAHLYLISLVAAIPAILAGRFLNRKLRREAFIRWVYGGLICTGSALVIEALTSHHS